MSTKNRSSSLPSQSRAVKLTPLQRRALLQQVNAQLPQTQCTRCGYHDCLDYAQAIIDGCTTINRCQPGGASGVQRLAQVTHQPVMELSGDVGPEGPRKLAVIDEKWCIGCTKCIQICPVDAIIGASKYMHTVIEDVCTGCELCIIVCPVDCIGLYPSSSETPAPTGWLAWSEEQAQVALERYQRHKARTQQRQRLQQQAKQVSDDPETTVFMSPAPSRIASKTHQDKRDFMAQILVKAREKSAHKK